jgi:4-hydroxy-4-methyl-2-oxoglutarate aldolase
VKKLPSRIKPSKGKQLTGNGPGEGLMTPTAHLKDGGLFQWIRDDLYVAAVSDILDGLGYREQVMHQRLRPLDPGNCVIVGRARTFRWMETDYIVEEDPYGLEIEAMDSLKSDDVAVHSTDYSGSNAPWGELMSTVAKRNGSAGCVCDSLIRDCQKIIKIGFPVFHAGIRPVDSKGRGRVMGYDVAIRCGGVIVNPGDLVFGDFDGVVVIPRDIESKVMALAAERVGKENSSRCELLKGRSLRDVFNQYGVL